VILLHAFPLDGSMWEGHAGERIDHPGTGSLADWADLVAARIERPEVVCGISMGGYAALEVVRRHPQAVVGLVLADTNALVRPAEQLPARETALERVRREGVEANFDAMAKSLFRNDPEPAVVARARAIAVAQPANRVIGMVESLRDRPDAEDVLASIAVPVVVVFGAEDAISPPETMHALAARIPDAQAVEIPAAGHLSAMEQPAAFAAACAHLRQ
jgi:pimeloyl-ACP methyl ester carboxylesterase